ncbi:spore gernimation protein GerPD [Virgibacillus indicus]|uniref:Spore gernimation protein GerPD n=1 Tax=Virgibacillus indicus TaxID=2024554 RepID=A0A265N7I2_9BACI|nr:spore gernimation protein GerPD [Virgibacillus indicus]OZU87962.1 spore gernimation protein GerPD [Virgibacillus indicus]
MNIEMHNWDVNVEHVKVDNIAASSVFLIGDNEEMALSSFFDTPPEAFTIGNIVPLAP